MSWWLTVRREHGARCLAAGQIAGLSPARARRCALRCTVLMIAAEDAVVGGDPQRFSWLCLRVSGLSCPTLHWPAVGGLFALFGLAGIASAGAPGLWSMDDARPQAGESRLSSGCFLLCYALALCAALTQLCSDGRQAGEGGDLLPVRPARSLLLQPPPSPSLPVLDRSFSRLARPASLSSLLLLRPIRMTLVRPPGDRSVAATTG